MHITARLVVLLCLIVCVVIGKKTIVSIQNTQFYINNVLTNAGSSHAAGLLLNSKMSQAIFDDENPSTVGIWNYPDTRQWNATRNTLEFVSNISLYSNKGLNAVTVGMQGSNPANSGKVNQACIVTGFNNSGQLKPAWGERLSSVIQATDQAGMVLILNLFDLAQEARLDPDDNNIISAVQSILQFLNQQFATNVMLDIADSCSNSYSHQLLTPPSIDTLIKLVQQVSNIPVSTSFPAGVLPPDNIIEAADFILLHASGLNGTGLSAMIHQLRNTPSYKKNPTPIVINQDSMNVGNLVQSVNAGVSWGYYSQGQNNYKDGFCSPPIDWSIDTVDKRAFFTEVQILTQN